MTMFVCQLLFIGTTELLLIGGMALLLFGGKKLPEMMRGLGQGVKEFKKGVNGVDEPVEDINLEDTEGRPDATANGSEETVKKPKDGERQQQ